jgi:hypothetical protein
MASTNYALTQVWSAVNRFAATSDVDIILSNVGGYPVRWELTDSDATPVITPALSHVINPGRSEKMLLLAGERLWMAGEGGSATVGV